MGRHGGLPLRNTCDRYGNSEYAENAKSPSFDGLLRGFVEMAGLEPASRTLLDKATTLISGVWIFVNHVHLRQRSVPYPECVFIRPFRQKRMKLTCASGSSSAGYAILRFQSKRIRRKTMAG